MARNVVSSRDLMEQAQKDRYSGIVSIERIHEKAEALILSLSEDTNEVQRRERLQSILDFELSRTATAGVFAAIFEETLWNLSEQCQKPEEAQHAALVVSEEQLVLAGAEGGTCCGCGGCDKWKKRQKANKRVPDSQAVTKRPTFGTFMDMIVQSKIVIEQWDKTAVSRQILLP